MNNKTWQSIFTYCLSALMVISFVTIIICLIFHLAPSSNNDLLYLLAGALGTMTGTIINYHYGSSKGSSDKNDMLFNSTPVSGLVDKGKQLIEEVKKEL